MSANYFVAQQRDLAAVNGYIEEMMNGQKVVKVFTHETESIEAFHELNDRLFHSADNANKFGNILMPVNAQIGNISYVLCAITGGILALNGFGGFTLGGLAGSERIFSLLDEKPEADDGYVTLVDAEWKDGAITETDKRTGMWAWKHRHQADGTVDYVELRGDVVFDDVDFGILRKKPCCTMWSFLPLRDRRSHLSEAPAQGKLRSQI